MRRNEMDNALSPQNREKVCYFFFDPSSILIEGINEFSIIKH